ncbi:MAG TPA: MBL fold metallo-hydrolase [Myxococcota bacterium]|nr:MBL fold metallo-hydrolase [Myxococcota bacterium]
MATFPRACIRGLSALLLGLSGGGVAAEEAVELRWLGVAGFSISADDTTLLHDPYLSRPGIWRTLTSWYEPDEAVLAPLFADGSRAPELARARAILIGHSHFDHLGDAPWIARHTGARVLGSLTSVSIAQAYGVEAAGTERLDPGQVTYVGPFAVRVIRSRHAGVMFGRVPLEGAYESPPEAPLHALSFPLGDARLYLVTHDPSGVRILLTSSASLHPPTLHTLRAEQLSVDVLLAATQGRDAHYARALVATFRPRLVVPHHYESFFTPLDAPDAAEPSDPEDVAAFEQEVRDAAAAEKLAVEVRRMALFETLVLPQRALAAHAGEGG